MAVQAIIHPTPPKKNDSEPYKTRYRFYNNTLVIPPHQEQASDDETPH